MATGVAGAFRRNDWGGGSSREGSRSSVSPRRGGSSGGSSGGPWRGTSTSYAGLPAASPEATACCWDGEDAARRVMDQLGAHYHPTGSVASPLKPTASHLPPPPHALPAFARTPSPVYARPPDLPLSPAGLGLLAAVRTETISKAQRHALHRLAAKERRLEGLLDAGGTPAAAPRAAGMRRPAEFLQVPVSAPLGVVWGYTNHLVVAEEVAAGSSSHRAGLRRGMVILSVDGTVVDSVATLQGEVDRAKAAGRPAEFLVEEELPDTSNARECPPDHLLPRRTNPGGGALVPELGSKRSASSEAGSDAVYTSPRLADDINVVACRGEGGALLQKQAPKARPASQSPEETGLAPSTWGVSSQVAALEGEVERLRADASRDEAERERLESQLGGYRGRLAAAELRSRRAEGSVDGLRAKVKSLTAACGERAQSEEDALNRAGDAAVRVAHLQSDVEALRRDLAAADDKIRRKTDLLAARDRALSDLRAQVDRVEAAADSRDALQAQLAAAKTERSLAAARLDAEQQQRRAAAREAAAKTEQLDEAERRCRELEGKLAEALASLERATGERAAAKAQAQHAEEVAGRLKAVNERFQAALKDSKAKEEAHRVAAEELRERLAEGTSVTGGLVAEFEDAQRRLMAMEVSLADKDKDLADSNAAKRAAEAAAAEAGARAALDREAAAAAERKAAASNHRRLLAFADAVATGEALGRRGVSLEEQLSRRDALQAEHVKLALRAAAAAPAAPYLSVPGDNAPQCLPSIIVSRTSTENAVVDRSLAADERLKAASVEMSALRSLVVERTQQLETAQKALGSPPKQGRRGLKASDGEVQELKQLVKDYKAVLADADERVLSSEQLASQRIAVLENVITGLEASVAASAEETTRAQTLLEEQASMPSDPSRAFESHSGPSAHLHAGAVISSQDALEAKVHAADTARVEALEEMQALKEANAYLEKRYSDVKKEIKRLQQVKSRAKPSPVSWRGRRSLGDESDDVEILKTEPATPLTGHGYLQQYVAFQEIAVGLSTLSAQEAELAKVIDEEESTRETFENTEELQRLECEEAELNSIDAIDRYNEMQREEERRLSPDGSSGFRRRQVSFDRASLHVDPIPSETTDDLTSRPPAAPSPGQSQGQFPSSRGTSSDLPSYSVPSDSPPRDASNSPQYNAERNDELPTFFIERLSDVTTVVRAGSDQGASQLASPTSSLATTCVDVLSVVQTCLDDCTHDCAVQKEALQGTNSTLEAIRAEMESTKEILGRPENLGTLSEEVWQRYGELEEMYEHLQESLAGFEAGFGSRANEVKDLSSLVAVTRGDKGI